MPYRLLEGHVLSRLADVETESVQTIVTSPPYFGLRDYRTPKAVFGGLPDPICRTQGHWHPQGNHAVPCQRCGAWEGQLGLEPEPTQYIEHLVQIFREARRCLKDDGTLWVNIGDKYAADRPKAVSQTFHGEKSYEDERFNGLSTSVPEGMKPKDLMGIPWMLAFALRDDGWWLRSEVIWEKPNPTPESVKDRPTRSHEQVFLLSKSKTYFYDYEAIKEPISKVLVERQADGLWGCYDTSPDGLTEDMRNKRDVWRVPTARLDSDHRAVFPEGLIEPCILAGSREGETVMDIFSGTGTTGVVAVRHGRSYIGIELLPESIEFSYKRINAELEKFPLLGQRQEQTQCTSN